MSLALCTCVLFISFIQSVNGEKCLNITILFVLSFRLGACICPCVLAGIIDAGFGSASPINFVVPFTSTSIYELLKSHNL